MFHSPLWTVTTIDPDGHRVTDRGLTGPDAVKLMLRRRTEGHTLPIPCAVPDWRLVPDEWLTNLSARARAKDTP